MRYHFGYFLFVLLLCSSCKMNTSSSIDENKVQNNKVRSFNQYKDMQILDPFLVFQVRGDTVKARQELERASGSSFFRLELIDDRNYSQKELLAINFIAK